MKPSIVFMGTPEFAVPALQALHQSYGVRAVVTIPDREKGRGLHQQPSDVKRAALDLGITTILQPTSLRDGGFAAELAALQPEILCVIAFRILPRSVYTLARLGAFNVHASLLPRHRGAAPINHAIMAGDTESGVTSFLLNDVVDTGTIVLQERLAIVDGMTAGDLYAALMPLAASCAVATTGMLLDGTAVAKPQDDTLATPAPKVYRETSAVDWSADRQTVRNRIHGLSPQPCAWTTWQGQVMKIFHVALADRPCPPSTLRIEGDTILVGCADGAVQIESIQMPGKKRMMAQEWLRGYRGPMEGPIG